MIKIGPYDYLSLIRSFLAQDRPAAKTAADRLSYHGHKLYSYNSVLARMDHSFGQTLYINKFTSTYSRTSIRQTKVLKTEAASNWGVFIIDLDKSIVTNLEVFWNEIELLITRYKRARTSKPFIKQSIHEAISTAQHFAEWHELDSTIPDILMRQLFVNQLLR